VKLHIKVLIYLRKIKIIIKLKLKIIINIKL